MKTIRIPALLLAAAVLAPAGAEESGPAVPAEPQTAQPVAAPATAAEEAPAAPAQPPEGGGQTATIPPAQPMPSGGEAAMAGESEPANAGTGTEAPAPAAETAGGAAAPQTAETPAQATASQAPASVTSQAAPSLGEGAEAYTPPLPPEYERMLRQLAEWQDYVKKQHEARKRWAQQRMERLRKEREEAVKRAIEEQEKLAKYHEAMRRLAEEQKAWIEEHRDEYLKQAEEREKGLLEYHDEMRRMAEERHQRLIDKLTNIDRLTRQEVQDLVEEMRRQMHEDALALDSAGQTEPGPTGQPFREPMQYGYGAGQGMPRGWMPQGGWQSAPTGRPPTWAGPQTGYPRTGGWDMPPQMPRGGWGGPMGAGATPAMPPGPRSQGAPMQGLRMQSMPRQGTPGGYGMPQRGHQAPSGMPPHRFAPGAMGPQSRWPDPRPRMAMHHSRPMPVGRMYRPVPPLARNGVPPAWRRAVARGNPAWGRASARPMLARGVAPRPNAHAFTVPRLALQHGLQRRPG